MCVCVLCSWNVVFFSYINSTTALESKSFIYSKRVCYRSTVQRRCQVPRSGHSCCGITTRLSILLFSKIQVLTKYPSHPVQPSDVEWPITSSLHSELPVGSPEPTNPLVPIQDRFHSSATKAKFVYPPFVALQQESNSSDTGDASGMFLHSII